MSRQRKPPKPGKSRKFEQSVMLRVMPDGSFRPANEASRKLCRDRGMRVGSEFVAYVYEPRDSLQWRQAHALGGLLVANVDEFEGKTNHWALKKIQADGGIACEVEKIDLGNLGIVTRTVPRSLAYGFMDNTKWVEVYRQMCAYIGRVYLGQIDAEAVEEMLRLMIAEPSA